VAPACWSLAHEELDTVRQLVLFEKACALDDSDSCLEAGRIYDPSVYADNGEFERIARSEARANPFYTKARRLFTVECAAGLANACYWLGLMSLSGWDADVSGERAIAFFVRACDLGDLSGCSQVASIYKFGWGGIAESPRKAAEWHERACDKGKVEECNSAAVLYEEGEGMPANLERAMRLYQRACEQGQATSCQRSGSLRARVRR
jgi:TPR repeat protein